MRYLIILLAIATISCKPTKYIQHTTITTDTTKIVKTDTTYKKVDADTSKGEYRVICDTVIKLDTIFYKQGIRSKINISVKDNIITVKAICKEDSLQNIITDREVLINTKVETIETNQTKIEELEFGVKWRNYTLGILILLLIFTYRLK